MARAARTVLTLPKGAVMRVSGCFLALLGGACAPAPPSGWSGYVEGDYIYMASPLGGRLESLAIQPGEQVNAGAILFRLDDDVEESAREQAGAQLEAARAQAANTQKGRRPDEIAVIRSQLTQAKAQSVLAREELARRQSLTPGGAVSASELDAARVQVTQAGARVNELEASLRTAELPARVDERIAAQAQAQAASAALRQSEWRQAQKQQRAPADARVADTYFRPGEYVNAGQPVVSLLPSSNIKARFFVPEAEVSHIKMGDSVLLSCDGCGEPIEAHVSRIATQPEYTPPVIYSNEQRAKLVFMVEARPSPQGALRLKPGQPLDVRRGSTP